MVYPEMKWKAYSPQNSIKEQYTPEGYFCEYPATLTSRWKIHDWEIIRTIYQYLRRIAQKKGQYYRKVLYVEYNFIEKPYEMTAMIKDDFSVLSQMVIWSQDQAEQVKIKQLFKDWTGIESLYVYIDQQVQAAQEWERGAEERARQAQEQARIKEERKRKRALNDPDNPAARKRKARRHLKRLRYDLHKTRKTRFDGKGYQIVKLDSGEIIAGENFDLTLDEVEQFYMDADYARRELWQTDSYGYLYNREPNLKQRKEKAQKALERMGYILEIDTDDFDGYGEYYKSSCYRIRFLKNKRKVKYYTDWNKNKYLLNGKKETFTLSEVEAFILSKS